jgi:hypothetical protein
MPVGKGPPRPATPPRYGIPPAASHRTPVQTTGSTVPRLSAPVPVGGGFAIPPAASHRTPVQTAGSAAPRLSAPVPVDGVFLLDLASVLNVEWDWAATGSPAALPSNLTQTPTGMPGVRPSNSPTALLPTKEQAPTAPEEADHAWTDSLRALDDLFARLVD